MRSHLSSSRTASFSASSLAALALVWGAGCERYDAPPIVEMVQPEGGAFIEGDPVVLSFSEPTDPTTIKIRIIEELRDGEGELSPDAQTLLDDCDATMDSCGDVTIARVEEDNGVTELSLTFDPDGLGAAGPPLVLELEPGIEDLAGNDTGPPLQFGVQFRPLPSRVNDEPVPFQNGVYTLVGQATLGAFQAVLRLTCDIKVDPSGEFFFAAAESNPIDGAPNTTGDPKELEIDRSELGWTVYTTGFVQLRDGRRLLESDPFDVFVPLGSIQITLKGVRLIGEVVKDENDNDRIDGSLSYESATVQVGIRPTDFEAGSAPLTTRYVPPEDEPLGGAKVCGPLCGEVTGYCEPPEGWPPALVCDTSE